ncbi:hypothetical protein [Pedobacter sp. SYSU D00535]|uniref:hypothetical protein n=1 Tax=Pedobacter sp. SYSU D00535 TaxID=2810308 RepID=UPI001A95FB51|nr:hypothetical protein [Pedobacter sp. SYSU D00535]
MAQSSKFIKNSGHWSAILHNKTDFPGFDLEEVPEDNHVWIFFFDKARVDKLGWKEIIREQDYLRKYKFTKDEIRAIQGHFELKESNLIQKD